MNVYILRWNPLVSSYSLEEHKELVNHIKKGEQPVNFNWDIHEYKELQKDDLFILLKIGTNSDGIAMVGKFKNACYEDKNNGNNSHYADMWIMDAFDCDSDNPLAAVRYEEMFPDVGWHEGHSGTKLQEKTAEKLLVAIEKDLIVAEIWQEDTLEKFIKWNFEQEQKSLEANADKRPSAEELADGKILLSLKEIFLKDQNENNFLQLICCLRDSVVRVPMHIELSDEDKKRLQENLDKGISEGEIDGNAQFYPMMLTNDNGEQAFPIFSNLEQMQDKYQDDECGIYEIPFLECIKFAKGTEDCSIIVLDAFTGAFVINMELAHIISNLKFQDEQ